MLFGRSTVAVCDEGVSCAVFSGRGAAIAVPGSVVSVAAFRATKSTLASDAFVLSVTFAAFWVFST